MSKAHLEHQTQATACGTLSTQHGLSMAEFNEVPRSEQCRDCARIYSARVDAIESPGPEEKLRGSLGRMVSFSSVERHALAGILDALRAEVADLRRQLAEWKTATECETPQRAKDGWNFTYEERDAETVRADNLAKQLAESQGEAQRTVYVAHNFRDEQKMLDILPMPGACYPTPEEAAKHLDMELTCEEFPEHVTVLTLTARKVSKC